MNIQARNPFVDDFELYRIDLMKNTKVILIILKSCKIFF